MISELDGGSAVDSYQRELEIMTGALADPTALVLLELLHACWGGRIRDID